jgi:hypothetical protein
MNRFILFPAIAIFILTASASLALDNASLIGTWRLVENARDKAGKPCPFVGQQIEFTAEGKMISPNMPVPFRYKVNPVKAEAEGAIMRNPELKGMEIMLAMMGDTQSDWSKAPIVYGMQLKGNQLIMKVSGYTPARYKTVNSDRRYTQQVIALLFTLDFIRYSSLMVMQPKETMINRRFHQKAPDEN